MKLCKDCANREKREPCSYYSITSNYAERCRDFEEIKQTWADKIRAMSDEELVKFLIVYGSCHACAYSEEASCGCSKCDGGIMKWLQSEVEE